MRAGLLSALLLVFVSCAWSHQCATPGFSCDDDATCCPIGRKGDYGCCPLKDAVCCPDGVHCCPHLTTCDVEHSACISAKGNETAPLVTRRQGTAVGGRREKLSLKRLQPPFRSVQGKEKKKGTQMIDRSGNTVCPGGRASCPAGATCCQLAMGSYGCCPLPNATCCPDKLHCCPSGWSCDGQSARCTRGKHSMASYKKMRALLDLDMDEDED